jgi:hypothetical protein
MTEMNSNSQPDESQPIVVNHERPLVRRIRLGLLGVVVALACFVAYRIGGVYASWREIANRHPTQQSMSPADRVLETAMMPMAGSWSFEDLDWAINSKKVSTKELPGHFASLSSSTVATSPEALPDVSGQFLTLAANLQITAIEQHGNRIYKLDRPEIKGQLVTREIAGREKIITMMVAAPSDGDQWLFYELTPRQAVEKSAKPVENLLPMPAGSKREGGKYDVHGELLLELISLNSRANDLLDSWRSAGWSIHETGLGDGTAFNYWVARGNETIYVWSADATDSLHNLMLVRNPGSEDTETSP